MDYRTFRRHLRTPKGQLILFAVTFTGALCLAVAPLLTRGLLFEPYIRHRVAELSEDLKQRGEDVASGEEPPGSLQKLSPAQIAGLYGALINSEIDDKENRLARTLHEFHSQELMSRLTITVAAGNQSQRRKALNLLSLTDIEDRSRAAMLCRHIEVRAKRTGDNNLHPAALRVLNQLDSEGDLHE